MMILFLAFRFRSCCNFWFTTKTVRCDIYQVNSQVSVYGLIVFNPFKTLDETLWCNNGVNPSSLMVRPVVQAVETWVFEKLDWMFAGNKELDKEIQAMLDWRRDQAVVLDFLLIVVNIQKFDGWKDDPMRGKVLTIKKGIEDLYFGWKQCQLHFCSFLCGGCIFLKSIKSEKSESELRTSAQSISSPSSLSLHRYQYGPWIVAF